MAGKLFVSDFDGNWNWRSFSVQENILSCWRLSPPPSRRHEKAVSFISSSGHKCLTYFNLRVRFDQWSCQIRTDVTEFTPEPTFSQVAGSLSRVHWWTLPRVGVNSSRKRSTVVNSLPPGRYSSFSTYSATKVQLQVPFTWNFFVSIGILGTYSFSFLGALSSNAITSLHY